MQKPIWVGIVGCGNAAVFHYASFLRVTGIPVEVVGVTSLQKARHEEFAVRRGIRTIDTLADLLSEVEVVDNCTPGYAHEPVSIAALDAGKHVIVEKPFTGYYGPPGAEAFEGNRFPKQTMLTRALSISGRVIAAAPSALAPTRSRAPRPS
jgi:hypothetical protein